MTSSRGSETSIEVDGGTAARIIADYQQMLRIRLVEEALIDLKAVGEVPGSMHLCIGQEAIPVGACRALGEHDLVTATYRGHGWALARGTSPSALIAEVMGKDSPLNGGRAGSPYLADPSVGLLGENSIVGAGLPIATGAALSQQRLQTGNVSLVSVGDGALNQGNAHEALNLAAVLRLPLVAVVENNVYSEMSRIADMVRIDRLSDRGLAYGIPAATVDGNDAQAVHEAVAEGVARARAGEGPTLVEAMTARLVGHYSGDAQHYRPKGEVAAARESEPIRRIRRMGEDNPAISDRLRRLELKVAAEVRAAVDQARALSDPHPATVKEHVYA